MNVFEFNAKVCENMISFWYLCYVSWTRFGNQYDSNLLETWK